MEFHSFIYLVYALRSASACFVSGFASRSPLLCPCPLPFPPLYRACGDMLLSARLQAPFTITNSLHTLHTAPLITDMSLLQPCRSTHLSSAPLLKVTCVRREQLYALYAALNKLTGTFAVIYCSHISHSGCHALNAVRATGTENQYLSFIEVKLRD
ncbi:hypothetical protein AOLI_G00182010, partial [Acnodon oligacanthus]